MLFTDLEKLFRRTGIKEEWLILPDESYILETMFRGNFESTYNPEKPYESLSANPLSSEGWQIYWDEFKAQGKFD